MDVGGIAGAQLLALVKRYERLQEEINALNDDKSELMKEIKSQGFDTKIFKIVVKRLRMTKDECDEEDTMVEVYERALAGEVTGDGADASRAGAGARARDVTSAMHGSLRDFVRDVPEDTITI